MDKSIIKVIIKYLLFGLMWAVILFVIGILITHFKNFNLKNVLFIEGIVILVGSLMASIGGNSTGLSLNGLGQNNAQYMANANLEVTKMERERNPHTKSTIKMGLSTVSLIVGGILTIILSFL